MYEPEIAGASEFPGNQARLGSGRLPDPVPMSLIARFPCR